MTLKNQEIKDFWTKTIPSYALIIVWFMFLIFSYYQSKNSDKVNIDISTTWDITTGTSTTWFDVTTGVVVEINTWEINSWTLLPPEWIREYLDYVLQNWIAGIDYISVEPPRPPIIRSDDKQVNNQVMFSYLDRTKIAFTIPNNQKKWYVLFITNKEVVRLSYINPNLPITNPLYKMNSITELLSCFTIVELRNMYYDPFITKQLKDAIWEFCGHYL